MELIDDDVIAPKSTANAAEASTKNNNLDIDFGDQDTMAKGDGFDKIAPPDNDKKRVVRVGLLTDVVSPKKDWVHFITNKGPYRCNSERDAKGLVIKKAASDKALENDDRQKAQLSVVVLALVYKNADPYSGKYTKKKDKDGNEYFDPIEWELGWVKLSRSGYRRVSMLIQEDQKPHEFDMLISHKDSGIGFDYSIVASKCRFRQIPELAEEVFEAAEGFKDGKKLTDKLGKKVSEADFRLVLAGAAASSSAKDVKVDDLSDLHDADLENCFAADQIVLSPRGLFYVDEIFSAVGLQTTCSNKETDTAYPLFNRHGKVENTGRFTHNGSRPVFRITTRSGNVVKTTANHPHLIMNTEGWWVWRKTKDINKEDSLIILRDYAEPIGNVSFLSNDSLYFLGIVLADGHLAKGGIGVTNNDPTVLEAIRADGAELFGFSPREYENLKSLGSFQCNFNSKTTVTELYKKLGWSSGVAKDKHLGPLIRSLDTESVREVLRGYFDCECSISLKDRTIEVISASWRLLFEIKCVLLSHFSILGTLKVKKVCSYPQNDYWRLALYGSEARKFIEKVGFRSVIRKESCERLIETAQNPNVDAVPNIGKLLTAMHESSEATRGHVTLVRDYKGEDPRALVTYQRLARILDADWAESKALERLSEINDAHYFYDPVDQVEILEAVPTFDFVMPESHSLVLNGLVSHNSQ